MTTIKIEIIKLEEMFTLNRPLSLYLQIYTWNNNHLIVHNRYDLTIKENLYKLVHYPSTLSMFFLNASECKLHCIMYGKSCDMS